MIIVSTKQRSFMDLIHQNLWGIVGCLVVFLISSLVIYDTYLFGAWQSTNLHWVSDLGSHTATVVQAIVDNNFPVYSLWYRLVYLLSGFSTDFNHIAYTSIVLLGSLVAAKYIISYEILKANTECNTRTLAIFSFALIFIVPVLSYYSSGYHIIVGNITPNQWHNATLTLAMPFNLMFFYYAIKNIQSDKLGRFLIMGALSILSLFCKPNYAMFFLPVLCSAILVLNFKPGKYLRGVIKNSLIAVPSILVLLYQWYFTMAHGTNLSPKTVIAPFLVWGFYTPNIIFSFIISTLFPLVVLVFYFKKMGTYLRFSWLTFLVALAAFSLVAEWPYWQNGNYGWGVIAASYILFLFSVQCLLNQPFEWKAKIAYTAFTMHFISGCFLLARFFILQTALTM